MIFVSIFLLIGAVGQGVHAKKKAKASMNWFPVVGQPYPDLDLIDQDGNSLKLSYLKGKVILVEPIGMSCKACQAFSGGQRAGPFKGVRAQPGLPSFHQFLKQYGGVKLPHRDVVLVQLLLYDMKMGNPKPAHAAEWAKHFDLRMGRNEFVTVSPVDMRSPSSRAMIPGFHLIDKDFILRADSVGYSPKHDLYRQLIPMVPKLLKK